MNANDFLTTTTVTYNDNETGLDSYRRGMPYSITRPDGTRTSYAYSYLSAYNAHDFEELHGRSTSVSGSTGYSTYFGASETIETVYMVHNKSVKRQRNINAGGKIYGEYESVQTPSSGLEIMGETYHTYESGGRLNQSKRQHWKNNYPSSSWNTIYEADYNGVERTSTTDAAGNETLFDYDSLGRLVEETEVASTESTYSDLVDRFVRYEYDGSNRIVEKRIEDGTPTESIVSSWEYDQAGRLAEKQLDCCNTNTYAYAKVTVSSKNYWKVTTTRPDVATSGDNKIEEYYFLDGSLAWRTGTGTTPIYIDHRADSNGWKMETWTSSDNTAAGALGLHGRAEVRNGIGATIYVRVPTPTGSRYEGFVCDDDYHATTNPNPTGRLLKKTVGTSQGASNLLSDYYYLYDELGRVEYEGFDTDGTAGLNKATDSRVVQRVQRFWEDTSSGVNVWYGEQIEYAYNGSSTGIEMSRSLQRVAPATGDLAEEWVFDGVGNQVEIVSEVDRGDSLVTVKRNAYPVPSAQATDVYKNGLLVKQTDHAGVVTDITYDHLRRKSRVDGRDSVAEITTYISGSLRTDQIKHDNGAIKFAIMDYNYNSNNWVSSMIRKNSTGDETTSYVYNARGQVTKRSGNGTFPIEYVYDSYGRLTEQYQWRNDTGSVESKVTFHYDDADETGNLGQKRHYETSTAYKPEYWEYDSLGRVSIKRGALDYAPIIYDRVS